MSTKDLVDFIEEKRKTCNTNLQDWLERGEITREIHQELTLLNEHLSQVVKTSFVKGENLVQKKVVSSLSELLAYEKKPHTDEEAFEVMRKLIVKGSENPYIRNLASNIAERFSQRQRIPVAVPPVDQLYLLDSMEKEGVQRMNAFINHCEKVAKNIYDFVRTRMVYVSDPPDDYYQPAYHTLEILNLKGDCDDLAILLCSLLRSIGYRTFLGFQPKHVFAGVVLARPFSTTTLSRGSEKEKIPTQYVEMPLDPQLAEFQTRLGHQKMVFNLFNVISGEFLDELDKLAKQAESVSEEDVKKTKGDLQSILDRLSQFSCAKVLFVDPVVDTKKTVAVLRDEISKFVDIRRSVRRGENAQETV